METFSAYWPCMKGIHQSPVDSPHKGRWSQTLMFSLICAWTNGWTNNQDAGDRRHHHAQWRHCKEVGSTLYYRSAARWDVWPKHYSLIWYKVFTIRALVLVLEFMASNDIGCIQYIPRNMHTVLLCFALLWLCNRSQWIHMKYLSIFIRVALLALGQSLDCHSASEVSLMDMGKSVNV